MILIGWFGFSGFAQQQDPKPLDLEDEDSVLLLKDVTVRIDAENRQTRVVHQIVRLLTEEAAEHQGEVSIPYNHYYEEPVLIAAATILPGGERIALEPDKAERLIPDDYAGYTMYSDAREFVFSMPRVVKGATLDYTVELRGKRTVIDGHVSGEHLLDHIAPVMTSRFSIVTDTPGSVNILSTNLPASVKRDGLTWSATNLERFRWEPAAPPVRQLRPRIAYSTLPDWKTLGDWFKNLLADRLEPEPAVLEKAAELIKDLPPEQHLERLYQFVQDDVRYVGIELGESAYKPHASAECLRHTYGDCKDQSLLLVHLLSKAGIKAHLALARPSYQGLVDKTLPMPNAFSHAIVHVPGKDLWLDPTMSYLDLPSYPSSLQGTTALVIDDDAGSLTDIPVLPADVDVEARESDIILYPDGLAISTSVDKPRGNAAAKMRASFADQDDWAKTLEEQYKRYDQFVGMLSTAHTKSRDRAAPFTNMVQLALAGEFKTSYEDENLLVYNYNFAEAARGLRVVSKSMYQRNRPGEDNERRHDYEIREPLTTHQQVRVHLPFGMKVDRLPRAIKRSFATGTLNVTPKLIDGDGEGSANILQIDCKVVRTPTLIPADQVSRVSRLIERQLSTAELAFPIRDEAMEALRRQPRKILEEVAAKVADSPDDPVLRVRYGELLAAVSQLHSAREQFRKAIELEPRQFTAYYSLYRTHYNANYLGKRCVDHDVVEPVYLQALEHVPDRRYVLNILSSFLLTGTDGRYGGEGARFDRVIELLTKELEDDPEYQAGYLTLFYAYVQTEAFDKADELALTASEKFPGSQTALFMNWRAAAFNGGIDLAVRQVTAAYADTPASRDNELDDIYETLVKFEKFEDAADLLSQRLRFVQPELRPAMEAQLAMVDAIAHDEPPPLPEAGSPEETAREFMGYIIRKDVDSVRKISSEFGFPAAILNAMVTGAANVNQGRMTPELIEKLNRFGQSMERVEHADGSVVITVAPKAEFEAILGKREMVIHLVKSDDDKWRVLTFGNQQFRLKGIEAQHGLKLLDAGKEDAAAAVFERLLDDCGQQARLGRPDPLCQIRDLDFPDEKLRYQAMAAVSQLGNDETSLPVIRKYLPVLIKHHPEHQLTVKTRLQLAESDKDVEDAAKALEIMVRKEPRMADQAAMIKGMLQFEVDQYQEAVDTLAPLLERYPNENRIRGVLARSYAHLGQADDAYRLAKDPEGARRPGDLFGLGGLAPQNTKGPSENEIEVAGLLGDKAQLEEYLDKAAEDEQYRPRPVRLWQAFNEVGDEESAREVALRNVTSDRGIFENIRAAQLHTQGHIDDARVLYERAGCHIDGSSPAPGILYYYATLDPERAVELLRKNYEESEQAPYVNYHIYLGEQFAGKPANPTLLTDDIAHKKLSEWETALTQFILGELSFEEAFKVAKKTKSSKQKDYLCELHCYQGQLHLLAGRNNKAKKSYEACRALKACRNLEHTIAEIRLDQIADRKKQKK